MFLIMTDGEENASQEFTQAKIKEMIEHQTNKYSWEFSFIGTNQNAVLTATNLGIAAGQALTFTNNGEGMKSAMSSYSMKAATYRSIADPLAAKTMLTFDDTDWKAQRDAQ